MISRGYQGGRRLGGHNSSYSSKIEEEFSATSSETSSPNFNLRQPKAPRGKQELLDTTGDGTTLLAKDGITPK